MTALRTWLAALPLLLPITGIAAVEPSVAAFFEKNCIRCHGPEKSKGDLRLDRLTTDLSQREIFERWRDIAERIDAGEMPPKKEARPDAAQAKAVVGRIIAQLAEASAKRRAEGRVVLRRLNRVEYQNTVRDLLGIDASVEDRLPLDTAAHGFDNIGEALHTSSFLMDRYLDVAEQVLNQAIVNRPQPPLLKKHYSLTETNQIRSTQEKVYRKGDDGRVVLFSSSPWQRVLLSPFYPNEAGNYQFTISAAAVQSGEKPVTFQVWSGSGGMAGPKGHLVSYFDAPPGEPKVIKFLDRVEPKCSISILPYGFANAREVHQTGADAWQGPGLAIDWVEVEGPVYPEWPPASHRRLFGDLRQAPAPILNQRDRVEVVSEQPVADARRLVGAFARRAFHRPVQEEDLEPIFRLVEKRLAEKYSFERAVRVGFMAVLTSPEFLFLREPPGRLDQHALATRLSYFLWSSLPDEELLAAAGKLSQPAMLHAQVERLLQDRKADAFVRNFTGQWLGLRDIDFTIPGQLLYPEFDDMLKISLVREAELFFAEVLRNDLSLTNFIASDFSMLNGRLAKHYGIPGVEGWEFHRVALPPESHRGGVLTMGAVLKVTANGTATSPVLRGAWVLNQILGTPPPKPPENVAALEPDTRGATTIRDRLAKHRTLETCASCHVKIDPPGFALESFDVIGGWRDFYRTQGNGKPVMIDGKRMFYREGPKVDPSDTLPDGRAFQNIDELKQLLLTNKDQIARALTTKLLTYATGAAPEASDQAEIGAIVSRAGAKNYGFRSLIHEIVLSKLFQEK